VNDAGAGQAIPKRPRDEQSPSAAMAPASTFDPADDDVFLQWTPRDRWFLAVLALIILALLGVQFARLAGWGLKPLEVVRPEERKYEFQIDVNRASWVEWMQLEGIGETTARKIVADREANGPFKSVDDVQRVKGIGPATLEKMRRWLVCEGTGEKAD
jgi:competence protein ComEA